MAWPFLLSRLKQTATIAWGFVEGTETSLFHFSVASTGHVLQIGRTKTCQKPGKMASRRPRNSAELLLYLCYFA
jgi:hypothetical protein